MCALLTLVIRYVHTRDVHLTFKVRLTTCNTADIKQTRRGRTYQVCSTRSLRTRVTVISEQFFIEFDIYVLNLPFENLQQYKHRPA